LAGNFAYNGRMLEAATRALNHLAAATGG